MGSQNINQWVLQMDTCLPVLITVQITREGSGDRGGVKILWARKEQMIHQKNPK